MTPSVSSTQAWIDRNSLSLSWELVITKEKSERMFEVMLIVEMCTINTIKAEIEFKLVYYI